MISICITVHKHAIGNVKCSPISCAKLKEKKESKQLLKRKFKCDGSKTRTTWQVVGRTNGVDNYRVP